MASEEDGGEKDEMKTILSSLALQHLLPVFLGNQVGQREIEMLVPEEFAALGVTTIGEKARLKHKCKDYLKGKSLDSPVMSKFQELNSKLKQNRNARKLKTTRRLYIGWKHGSPDVYRLVHPSKGGGQFVQGVSKGCILTELRMLLLDLYFPSGHCKSGNLYVNEVNATVVNYSGHALPEKVGDDHFTVRLYCNSRKSNPVRICLQTKKFSFTLQERYQETEYTEIQLTTIFQTFQQDGGDLSKSSLGINDLKLNLLNVFGYIETFEKVCRVEL